MADRPDWLVPGQQVVLLTPARMSGAPRLRFVTIDRVLKRDLVCDDGTRVNADQRRIRSGDAWSPDTVLLHPDDPEVAKARDAIAKARTKAQVHQLGEQLEQLGRGREDDVLDAARRLCEQFLADTAPTPAD